MKHSVPWLVGGFVVACVVAAAALFVRTHPVSKEQAAQNEMVRVAEAHQISPVVQAAGTLPDSVDLVIVVDRASELRLTPVGRAFAGLMDVDDLLPELEQAWSGLAKQLGYADQDAVDRLVGQRVVFASRPSVSQPTERVWAIMSDVSLDTEKRIRERLEAAPRSIDAGRQILSIEQGRFELTTSKPATDGSGTPSVTLIMGPAGRSELFDELVGVLSKGTARPLSATDALSRAAVAGKTEALLLARLGDTPAWSAAPEAVTTPAAAGEPSWRNFVLVTGRRAEGDASSRSWRTRVLVRDSSKAEALRRIEPTSDAAFTALSKDAIFAAVQSSDAPLTDVLGSGLPFELILGDLPLPERAKELVKGRQAVVLRKVGDAGFACSLALETPNVGAVAPVLDASMSRGIQTFEQRLGIVAPEPRDYAGVMPAAVRVEPLQIPETSPMRTLVREPVSVAWSYPTTGRDGSAGHVAPGSEGVPGWWAMTLTFGGGVQGNVGGAGEPATVHAQDARSLIGVSSSDGDGQAGTVSRWVGLARLRAAELDRMMPEAVPDFRSIRSMLKRVEELNVRLRITDEGDIEGEIGLELVDSAAQVRP